MEFILYGLILAIPALIIQLFFCYFVKYMVFKLIPVYVDVICAVLLVMMYFGAFGTWSMDILGDGHTLAAGILGALLGISFIGNIVAWVIYLLHKKKLKKEN